MMRALLLLAAAGAMMAQTPCEELRSLKLPPGGSMTSMQVIPAGGLGMPRISDGLPAFCRVTLMLKPSDDSDIRAEVWMPATNWNGKFQGVGNPGWAGAVNYADLASAVRRGYAAVSTDTGHTGASAEFALGHPEKLVDFGYRSEHEMTVNAKVVVAAFYGIAPERSYFYGCSSGGRQALMEAQRFPNDYDGIIAGAPTNNWTNMMFGRVWIAQATLNDAASYIPPAKYPVIHKAALDACDALDGVKDGVIDEPTKCHFDPKVIQCAGADGPGCLTAAQVEAARKIYAPAKNSRTGETIFPGMQPGSELVWATLAGGPKAFSLANDHFRFVVFQNPEWDFRTLNFDSDIALAEKAERGILGVTNPSFREFFAHGGKLIHYHGWTDQQVQSLNSVNFYSGVAKEMGGLEKARESYRLFMAPGMNHCGGGDGPNSFDTVGALEQWVEKGTAPEQMIAAHRTDGKVDRTRPLCPWPQVARYKGTGSTDEAANFSCAVR